MSAGEVRIIFFEEVTCLMKLKGIFESFLGKTKLERKVLHRTLQPQYPKQIFEHARRSKKFIIMIIGEGVLIFRVLQVKS